MSIAIYEDVQTGRQHWADSTSPTTADHLAEGDWVLFDDTPATPPPPGDPLDLAMTAVQANQGSAFFAAQRAASVAAVQDAIEAGDIEVGPGITPGTVAGQVPVWNGTDFVPASPIEATAADVPFTPAAGLAATDVQAAIEEVARAGGTTSGVVAPLVTGAYTTASHGQRSTIAMTLARLLLIPVYFDPAGPNLDALAVEVTAIGAGAVIRLGVYERLSHSTADLTLVAEATGTADGGTLGLRSLPLPTPITHVGRSLWLGVVVQGVACTLRSFGSGNGLQIPLADPSGTAPSISARMEGVTGALPATPALVAAGSQTAPLVWARAAA